MKEIKIIHDNGTTETRTIDEKGQANGLYSISNSIEVIETGNLKNVKRHSKMVGVARLELATFTMST